MFLNYDSNNNAITDNAVNNNDYGIYIDSSDTNTVAENVVDNNSYGIYLFESRDSTIKENIVSNNTGYGIHLHSSKVTEAYHNNLINNSMNAFDNWPNSWDNGLEGNYWDDYNGTDLDGDGIGDSFYNISGGETQDNYPLMQPYFECSVRGDHYPCNGIVLEVELLDYINLWVSEEVTDFDLLAAIDNWAFS
ncbi:MAG: right-handed parallel beta-helix repeat-containing protein [Candidatus Altiarchaeales archaeon]|nr:right-handed parallel beta-helix repeat-containing protein [Candidatus Altiarchaeales archaeon]